MKFLITLLAACTLFTNCSKSNPTTDNTDNGTPPAGMVKGKIVNAQGQPVSGAKVYASHDTWFNTHVIGQTDANGNYQLNLKGQPAGTWSVYAQLAKNFNGKNYDFRIDPENTASLTTTEGGIRNMIWKLTGVIPGSTDDTRMGGYVVFMGTSDDFVPVNEIEIKLVPQGTLVDGSTGTTIVRRAEIFPVPLFSLYANEGLRDIPVGRYAISARRILANGSTQPMEITTAGGTVYTPVLTTDFFQEQPARYQQVALNIRVKI